MADSTASLVLPPLIRRVKEVAPNLTLQTLTRLSRDPCPGMLRGKSTLLSVPFLALSRNSKDFCVPA